MIGGQCMTREQKELLYDIACWHSKDFYNNMVDTWSSENYSISTECSSTIFRLEQEYINKYGPMPKWEYINDVWNAMEQLKKELEEN
jgi:hypothetical protein